MVIHDLQTWWDTDQTNSQTCLPPAFLESAHLGLSCHPDNGSYLLFEEPGNLLYQRSGEQLWVNRFTTPIDFLC